MKNSHFISRVAGKLAATWLAGTVKRPVYSLVLALVLTAGLGYLASSLSVRTNMEDLFPEDTPNVQRAQEARRLLASSSQIILAVTSPDAEANRRFLDDLAARLAKDPLIGSMEVKRDISFFRRNALLFLDEEELGKLDDKLARAIRKAVEKDMNPLGEEEADAAGADEGDDGFDDGFGDSPEEPADEFDDGFADPAKEAAAQGEAVADVDDEEGFRVPTEEEIQEKYGIRSLSEYISSKDGTVLGMKIYPSFSPNEVSTSQKLISNIQAVVDELNPASYHPELAWDMEGDYHSKIEEMSVIKNDLSRATLFAVAVIVVLVALFFGNLRSIVFVMIPLFAGIAWTMGVAFIAVGYLNLITAFIFAILFGLGVDFAVHAVSRYQEELRAGRSPEEAIELGLAHLGRPLLSAAITTTVTFFSLVVFRFRGFSQFGLIAGLGVPISLAAVYAFFPPLALLVHRFFPEKVRSAAAARSANPWLFSGRRPAVLVITLLALVVGALGFGFRSVSFESDMKQVMTPRKGAPKIVMQRYRREVESRSASPIVMLTGSREETRKVSDYLEANAEKWPLLQEYASIYSFIPAHQSARLALIAKMKKRLDQKMGALKGEDLENAKEALRYLEPDPGGFTEDDLPEWTRAKFTDTEGNLGHFVLLYAHGNKADAKVVDEIVAQLGEFQIDGKTYHSTASYYILLDAYNIVLHEGPLAVLLAALMVLLILIFDLQRWKDILVAFGSLVVGVIGFIGYMGWAGVHVNMFNMVILPTVFGIGVDTSIHLLHRIREEGSHKVGEVANTTGSAAFLSAVTTAVGFGSLAFATNPGLAGLGMLAPVGIIGCYLSSLLLTCSVRLLVASPKPKEAVNGTNSESAA